MQNARTEDEFARTGLTLSHLFLGRIAMRVASLLSVVAALGLSMVTAQAAPVAILDDAQPGLNVQVPFGGDGFGNTYAAYPTQWGGLNGTSGIDPTSGRIVNDTDSGYIRYRTTNKGQNPAAGQYTVTPMSTAQDWVFSTEWESNMQATAGTVFELSAANDVARFESYNSSGQYRLLGGDGSSSGYSQIAVFALGDITANTVHTLTLHYKASNSRLDFYIDGVLKAADFQSRGASPGYALDFVQLGGGRTRNSPSVPAIDAFDNVLVGIAEVPEPATTSLLALAGLTAIRRRR